MSGKQRYDYIDWLRGLACLGMIQAHCYDSWLSGSARESSFFRWSQLLGTLPAPLFLFLAGVSCALVTDRMRRKGVSANAMATTTIHRGAEILGLGLLFRLQEFLLGLPKAPWTDLLRVDILNTIGISIMAIGIVCWMTRGRTAKVLLAAAIAAAIALATPPLWTTWCPRWLPWYLESYINGVHLSNAPQPWLFPLFPWMAFAFAGLAAGLLLFADWPARNTGKTIALFGGVGAGLLLLSIWLDARPDKLYAVYDYWHASPAFFMARVGVLLLLMLAGYAWCRSGAGGGQALFSPLIQMGQTSLLVYWAHIEFVYGKFSILPKGAETIPAATMGMAAIFIAMALLSMARTRCKGRGREILERFWGDQRQLPSATTD